MSNQMNWTKSHARINGFTCGRLFSVGWSLLHLKKEKQCCFRKMIHWDGLIFKPQASFRSLQFVCFLSHSEMNFPKWIQVLIIPIPHTKPQHAGCAGKHCQVHSCTSKSMPGLEIPVSTHSWHKHYLKANSFSGVTLIHTKYEHRHSAVTLWHLLSVQIQSTFIKCFALLASTVRTIMQMVKTGRELCKGNSGPLHSGPPPGWDQSCLSSSCLYS